MDSVVLHNAVGIILSAVPCLLGKPLSICIGKRVNAFPVIGFLEDKYDLAPVALDRSTEVFSGSTQKQIHHDRCDTAIGMHVVTDGKMGGIELLFQRGASLEFGCVELDGDLRFTDNICEGVSKLTPLYLLK